MENAHEYQDALGFTTVATDVVNSIAGGNESQAQAKTEALKILNDLASHWPSLIPPDTLSTEAGALFGAAARMELLALGIE